MFIDLIDDEANDFNYYRGNIYLKNAIGEDGKATIISPDELVYDTLPNGKVTLKRLLEIWTKFQLTKKKLLRQNFSESDNRNYRDGDKESTRLFASYNTTDRTILTKDLKLLECMTPRTILMYLLMKMVCCQEH